MRITAGENEMELRRFAPDQVENIGDIDKAERRRRIDLIEDQHVPCPGKHPLARVLHRFCCCFPVFGQRCRIAAAAYKPPAQRNEFELGREPFGSPCLADVGGTPALDELHHGNIHPMADCPECDTHGRACFPLAVSGKNYNQSVFQYQLLREIWLDEQDACKTRMPCPSCVLVVPPKEVTFLGKRRGSDTLPDRGPTYRI